MEAHRVNVFVFLIFLFSGAGPLWAAAAPSPVIFQMRKALGVYSAGKARGAPADFWKSVQQGDGSFSDLDYKGEPGGRFDLPAHFARVNAMAVAGGDENEARWKAALTFALALPMAKKRPGEGRFWRRDVVLIPGALGETLALFYDRLDPNLAKDALAFAKGASGGTGGLGGTALLEALWCRWYLALATVDTAVLDRIKPDFEGLLIPTWDGERGGLHLDGSFTKAEGVVDFGGDGLVWARAVDLLMKCQEGTPYDWMPRVKDGAISFLLGGNLWASSYPVVRQVLSRTPGLAAGNPVAPPEAAPVNLMKVFPVADALVKEESGWVTVLRLSSRRTKPFEWVRGEPEGVWHLGDGLLVSTPSGEDPQWDLLDPKRLPGTTVIRRDRALRGYLVRPDAPGTAVAGAVAVGSHGVAIQVLDSRDDTSPNDGLAAQKVWFFFSNHITVALGNGISSSVSGSAVETVVDQRVVSELPPWATASALDGKKTLEISGLGYFFPREGSLRAQGRPGAGGKSVLSLWVDHGLTPSNAQYAYGVVPGANVGATGAASALDRFKIIQQDAFGMAVKDATTGETGYAFFGPGEVDELSASRSCAVWSVSQGPHRQIWVADPSQVKEDILIRLRGIWAAKDLPPKAIFTKAPGGVVLRLPVTNGITLTARLEERENP